MKGIFLRFKVLFLTFALGLTSVNLLHTSAFQSSEIESDRVIFIIPILEKQSRSPEMADAGKNNFICTGGVPASSETVKNKSRSTKSVRR